MTTYIEIPDADVAAERPITTGLMTKIRDNPLAIAEGDPTAPSINPAALTIGGKGGDGVLDNATPAITEMGFYEFSTMEVTVARSLPVVTLMRLSGDSSLSAVLTVAHRRAVGATAPTPAEETARIAQIMGAGFGLDATAPGGANGLGGSAAGSGGYMPATSGISPADVYAWWALRRPLVGGNGSGSGGDPGTINGPGGGCLILICEGDLDLTGGTINVDGGDTNDNGGGGNQPGAGGGGCLIVICTGTLTGGTFHARGGAANALIGGLGGAGDGGGGGGGWVVLVAQTFTGTQTIAVTGGASDVAGGTAGYSDTITLTRDQIRTILQRL